MLDLRYVSGPTRTGSGGKLNSPSLVYACRLATFRVQPSASRKPSTSIHSLEAVFVRLKIHYDTFGDALRNYAKVSVVMLMCCWVQCYLHFPPHTIADGLLLWFKPPLQYVLNLQRHHGDWKDVFMMTGEWPQKITFYPPMCPLCLVLTFVHLL